MKRVVRGLVLLSLVFLVSCGYYMSAVDDYYRETVCYRVPTYYVTKQYRKLLETTGTVCFPRSEKIEHMTSAEQAEMREFFKDVLRGPKLRRAR